MKWTVGKALLQVSQSGANVNNKIIIAKDGVKGLKTCSAIDYLVNYCGYLFRGKTFKELETEVS